MLSYVRPYIPAQVFRNASGEIVNYGERWHGEQGPDDTYEVISHPERFQAIHDVADALIKHLVENYDVSVSSDLDTSRPDSDRTIGNKPIRIVRLSPIEPTAAPLTFVFWSFPSLTLQAGAMADFHYPTCGCDHCDEEAGWNIEELERNVGAVVDGRLRETLSHEHPPWSGMEVRSLEGDIEQSGRGLKLHLTPAQIDVISQRLDALLDAGWNAWLQQA